MSLEYRNSKRTSERPSGIVTMRHLLPTEPPRRALGKVNEKNMDSGQLPGYLEVSGCKLDQSLLVREVRQQRKVLSKTHGRPFLEQKATFEQLHSKLL